jgi:hypothetical protein
LSFRLAARGVACPTDTDKKERDRQSGSGLPGTAAVCLRWVKKNRRTTPLGREIRMRHLTDGINHVLKNSPSTHGCQHIVEISRYTSYDHGHGNKRGIPGRRSGGERPPRTCRWCPRRARGVARAAPIRRSPTTFCGSLVSRVGNGSPKPRRELAGDRGGGGRNHTSGGGTSVQPCGQGASIEDGKKGMGGQRAQSRGPPTRSHSRYGYEVTSGSDASARRIPGLVAEVDISPTR